MGYASSSDIPTNTSIALSDGSIFKCESGQPVIFTSNGTKMKFSSNSGAYRPVSSIEDRFGNTITYTYLSGTKIKKIARNDGANVNFTYIDINGTPNISQITYGDRTINYSYTFVPTAGYKLDTVTDAEGRETKYTYYQYGGGKLQSVQLPTGAKLEYFFRTVNPDIGHYGQIRYKKISGSDIKDREIFYKLNTGALSYAGTEPRTNNHQASEVMIWEPNAIDGNKTLYTRYLFVSRILNSANSSTENDLRAALSGKIEQINIWESDLNYFNGTNEKLKYSQVYLWDYVRNGTVGCNKLLNGYSSSRKRSCVRARLQKQTTVLHNEGGKDIFIRDPLTFDQYGYVTSTKLISNDGRVKYKKQAYLHDKANWILGLPTVSSISSNNSSWEETKTTSYWSATHSYKSLPKYEYLYGNWLSYKQSYHSNGELKKVIYNGSNRYEILDNYKRGKPQTITVPKRYSTGTDIAYRIVDDFGNVTSYTNFNGIKTDFYYDKINRLIKKDYINVAWADELVKYYDEANYLVQSVANYRHYKYTDSLGRLKKIREEDVTNSATRLYRTYAYDKNGSTDFVSYKTSNPNPTLGKRYKYDALGRRVQETDAEITRSWSYLNDHKVKFINSRNHETTTAFLSYGLPDYNNEIEIVQYIDTTSINNFQLCPEYDWEIGEIILLPCPGSGGSSNQSNYVLTRIDYNLFNKIEKVIQDGFEESYIYDNRQQLCKTVRNDIGSIGYGYNLQRQPIWEAKGSTGAATACGGESATQKMPVSYDNRGGLKGKYLSNGRLLSEQTLDAIGNVVSLKSNGVTNTYQYNDRNLITKQTTTIDGKTFTAEWKYSNLGHNTEVKYPSNRVIRKNPNALGQPTTAGSYAIAASYHGTGKLISYEYGNKIKRTYDRDIQGATLQISDNLIGKNINKVLFNQGYTYDSEYNITNIEDKLEPQYSLTNLKYDGLGRLKSGNGYWGVIENTYDKLGNITKHRLGSKTLNYNYDSNKRLSSITGSITRNFSYDDRGNTISNGIRTFAYDQSNQMIASGLFSFVYGGDNLRIKKQLGGNKDYFIYDTNGRLMHRQAANGVGTDYIYLSDNLVAEVSWSSLSYIHSDLLGSTAAESNSSAIITKRYHYEPFGKTLELGQDDDPGYTGHLYDQDLELNYMKARYYDPLIGRFYSNDPIGFTMQPQTFNRYSYVNNNPYKYTDPDGKAWFCLVPPATAGCAAVAGAVGEGLIYAGTFLTTWLVLDEITDDSGSEFPVGSSNIQQQTGEGIDEGLNDADADLDFDRYDDGELGERGWTEEEISDLVNNTDPTGSATDNRKGNKTNDGEKRDNEPASVYGDEKGHVVVNDRTKEVIQVSDKNNPNWVPDSRIKWKKSQ